jgi:hypothetical protein
MDMQIRPDVHTLFVALVTLASCAEPNPTSMQPALGRGRLFGHVFGGTGIGIGGVELVLEGPFGRREAMTPAHWWEAGRFSFDRLPDDGLATLTAMRREDTVRTTIDFARLTPFPMTVRMPQWQLAWEDGFDGERIDESRWRLWNEISVQAGTIAHYLPGQVAVENGVLRLRTDAPRASDGKTPSGGMSTHGSQRYGRFEIRARLPRGQGMWPAHWVVAADSTEPVFEFDIMELLGHNPHRVYFHNHWLTSQAIIASSGTSYSGPDFSADYHTFRLDWYVGNLVWYVDGVERFRSLEGVGDRRARLLINTQVGGHWEGPPDETTQYPQFHDVDWVRVYSLER